MLGQKSSNKKNPLIKDFISVQDIVLEYVIDRGWKDYKKFARIITEKIISKPPSTRQELTQLANSFGHPFFTFNGITKKEFVSGFPLVELLRQSQIPRRFVVAKAQHLVNRRKSISKKIRLLILERDKFRCSLCGKNANETKLEVDHKVPVAKGGTDSLNNLRTLCIDCNRGKSDLFV